MSKVPSPLEALKLLLRSKTECTKECIVLCETNSCSKKELYNTIKKVLEEYESRKTFLDNIDNDVLVFEPKEIWEEKNKKLKALEIIKRKAKIVDYSPTEYPPLVIFQGFEIDNKEQYDLLKEVLL